MRKRLKLTFPNKISAILLITCLFELQGCLASNGRTYLSKEPPEIDYEFTGIPLVYMGFGSSVPLTAHLSLTAAHVAELAHVKVVSYHPSCDVAIIESDNHGKVIAKRGLVYQGQKVALYGKRFDSETIQSNGVYHFDLIFVNDKRFRKCQASITDAAVQSGMSGGGAYNEEGELVGIISGLASESTQRLDGEPIDLDRLSVFISINYIRPWLDSVMQDWDYSGSN